METKFCYGCMRYKQTSPVCELCGFDERNLNESHQLPIGTVLKDQYVIGRVLGEGGFGITYIGWDRLLEMPVAIKEYFPRALVHRDLRYGPAVGCNGADKEVYEKHRNRFLKEARTIAQLSSVPEIVQIKNFFAENNTAYIVMEYVQGITLKDTLKRLGRPMTEREALAAMEPVLRGLEKVHDRNMIHRDISPDNIMIPADGGVKLIDFGTARNMDDSMRSRSTESILKPGFAPMEQYNSRGNIGTWTDVYAICATFHYLLVGKLPPDAPSRIEEGEALPMLDAMPGISTSMKEALQKGMAIRVADRIQTIAQLRELLYSQPERAAAATAKPADVPVRDPQREPERKPAQVPESRAEQNWENKSKAESQTEASDAKRSSGGLFLKIALAVVMLIALGVFGLGRFGGSASMGAEQIAKPVAQDITLSVWTLESDQAPENNWMEVMMQSFEQLHPEYNITWNVAVFDDADIGTTAKRDPSAFPDVYMYINDQIGTLADAGVLSRLEGSHLQQVKTDVAEAYVNCVTYSDGSVYGFPMAPNTWFMWYNKSVFSEEDVKNLNTMLEKGVVAFSMGNAWYNASFFLGAGGTLFGPRGIDGDAGIDFSSEHCTEAGKFMIDFANHRNFFLDMDGYGVYGMINGDVHAMFSGSWDYPELHAALGDDLGCTVLPSFTMHGTDYPMMSFAGCKAIGVNPNAAYHDAALQLAAFMASAESQLLRYRMTAAIPAATACIENAEIAENPVVLTVSSQAATRAVAQPVILEMGRYWDPFASLGQKIVDGTANHWNIHQLILEAMEQSKY